MSISQHMSVLNLQNAIDKDHYLVAAYDSTEYMNKKIVVVDDSLDDPTWILRSRARKVSRRNIIALAVPSIEDLTLEHAQELTRMGTDFITIRTWSQEDRRAGRMVGGAEIKVW